MEVVDEGDEDDTLVARGWSVPGPSSGPSTRLVDRALSDAGLYPTSTDTRPSRGSTSSQLPPFNNDTPTRPRTKVDEWPEVVNKLYLSFSASRSFLVPSSGLSDCPIIISIVSCHLGFTCLSHLCLLLHTVIDSNGCLLGWVDDYVERVIDDIFFDPVLLLEDFMIPWLCLLRIPPAMCQCRYVLRFMTTSNDQAKRIAICICTPGNPPL